MSHDPIVDEVRAIRERLAAQFDFDITKIVEDARRRQAESGMKTVSFLRPVKAMPPIGSAPTISENPTSSQT